MYEKRAADSESISPRTVKALRELTEKEAELFLKACTTAVSCSYAGDRQLFLVSQEITNADKEYSAFLSEIAKLQMAGLIAPERTLEIKHGKWFNILNNKERCVKFWFRWIGEGKSPTILLKYYPFTEAGEELRSLLDYEVDLRFAGIVYFRMRQHYGKGFEFDYIESVPRNGGYLVV